jgi:arylsulfatase
VSLSRKTIALGLLGLASAGAGLHYWVGRGAHPQPEAVAATGRVSLQGAVVVVLDAARAGSFGCYGGRRGVTPAVDALARESIVFEQAFTPAVYTRAAMNALWASRPPGEPGLPKAPRLAEILRARGFQTAGFSANPNAGRTYGHARGFSEFHELEGPAPPRSGPLVERFVDFLGRVRGRFFAYVHVREPHFPYDPPAPFSDRFGPPLLLPMEAFTDPEWLESLNRRGSPTPGERGDLLRRYEANLAYADHLVDRLRAALVTAGLWEETALVVTADHGEAMGEHGFVGHNEQVFVESAQVPLVMRVPGLGARRLTRLASLMDVAPTLAVLLGAAEAGGSFRGVNLLGPDDGRRRGLACVTVDAKTVAWRDDRYTLVLSGDRVQLFDRHEDPGESRDRARDWVELRTRLLGELRSEWGSKLKIDAAEGAVPDPDTRRMLRALGYVQ